MNTRPLALGRLQPAVTVAATCLTALGEPGWFKPVVEVNPATGLPARLVAAAIGPDSLLAGPGRLALREAGQNVPGWTLAAAGTAARGRASTGFRAEDSHG